MAIVAAIAAILAAMTLGAIKEQVTANADEAKAAADNAKAAADAASAARESILLTHRPKIDVREIEMPEVLQLFEVGDHGPGFSAFQKALELRGTITQLNASFRLTNVGASDATMHYMGGTVFVGERLPHSNPAIGKPLGTGFTGPIKPGHTTRTSIPTRPVTTQELYDIRMGYTSIFVVGKLIYHDALKNYRRTGFARRFDVAAAGSGRCQTIPTTSTRTRSATRHTSNSMDAAPT